MPAHDESQPFNFAQDMRVSKRFAANMLMSLEATAGTIEARKAILQEAGIDEAAYNNPSFLISADQELKAFAIMGTLNQSGVSAPVLGFQYGVGADISLFGIVGIAAQMAPNLFEAIRVTTMFPELLAGTSLTAIHIDRGATILSCQFDQMADAGIGANAMQMLAQNMIASNLFIFERYISQLAGVEVSPKAIMLPMPEPDDWYLVVDDLRFDVQFNADEGCLVYEVDLRDVPTKTPNPMLHKLFLEQAETLAATLREDLSVKERVARYLWTLSPPPNREEVARKLGLSVRSLSRHLQAENTSFKEMFLDIQLRRAKIMLQDTKMTAASIAFQLGFNDPASFTRSFRTQTGKTPTQWRE